MISKQAVEDQLKRIGCNFRFWGRSEVNELGRILLDDEIIAQCVNGEYTNGFAMLVATNHRVLLVDKKPLLYLTVEDLRYEMITEFNFSHRMMNATMRIYTANKTLQFTSWNQHRLRLLLEYIQSRVLEMRQQQHLASQFNAAAAAQYAQLHAAYNQHMGQPSAPTGQGMGSSGFPQPNMTQDTTARREVDPIEVPSEYHGIQAQMRLQQSFTPPIDVEPAPATASAGPVPVQDQDASAAGTAVAGMAARLASRRTALGTYTRSKLPNLRRRNQATEDGLQLPPAESGEVFQGEYRPKPNLGGSYSLPYEYEG